MEKEGLFSFYDDPHQNLSLSSSYETQKNLPTIFDFYSIENTVNFLKNQLRQGDLREEDLEGYLWREVRQTIGEFVFKEKRSRIFYEWGNNFRLYPEGLPQPAAEIFRSTADKFQGREKAELEGFLTIEENFQKGNANIAFWISPPSPDNPYHGDYGFVFVFINQGERVVVEIVRYSEDRENLSQSWTIYDKLGGVFPENILTHADEFFLSHPIFLKSEFPSKKALLILKNIGILSEDDRDKNLTMILLEDSIFKYLYKLYQETVFSLVEGNFSNANYQQLLALAKIYFTRLYNRALFLSREKTDSSNFDDDSLVFDLLASPSPLPEELLGYLDKQTIIEGGGSCPVISSENFSFGRIINYSLATALTEENYDFDHEGICAICGQGPKPLGPCGICKECDEKLKKKDQLFES